MTTLSTSLVNVGLSPNDGTGNNLRDAFIKQNNNVTNISEFLILGPTFTTVNVTSTLESNVIIANLSATLSNVIVSSGVGSDSPINGALRVVGGAGITENLNVAKTIVSNVSQSTTALTGALIVTGDAAVANNLQAKVVTAETLHTTKDVVIDGKLTVLGNVTTLTNTELYIKNSTIEIGKPDGATLSSNDGESKGIDFHWYEASAATAREGFFGFDNTNQCFTYIPRKTVSGDTAVGDLGDARFNTVNANVSASGTSTFANVTVGNVTTTGGYYGNVRTASQPHITSLGTLTGLTTSGNVTVNGSGNINIVGTGYVYINGVPVATSDSAFHGGAVPLPTQFTDASASVSNSTGAVVISGGLGVQGNINVGGTINVPIFNTNVIGGTLMTEAQPNITSLGILTSLSVSGSSSLASVSASSINASGAINASTLTASTSITGTLNTSAQPNITSLGTLTALNVTGNVTANTFNGTLNGNVTGATNVTSTNLTGTLQTAAQPNVTSVGTLTGLTVSGNTNTAAINSSSTITATTSVTAPTLSGTLSTVAQPNITSVGNLTGLSVNGSASVVNNLTVGGAINASGSGTQAIGSTTNRFGAAYVTSLNSSGTITAGSFSGPMNGSVGASTPSTGAFTNITSAGNVAITTSGAGVRYPDGTFQTTATGMPYTLMPATATTLGGIKVGNNLTIDASGVLAATGSVSSVFGRTGAVTMTMADVTSALGFTPYNATNPSGYLDGNNGVKTQYNSSLNTDSRNSRGVTRLYRSDSDQDFSVQTTYTGSHYQLRGYNGDTFYAECRVGYADTLQGYTASTANTANTVVLRDASGNFAAGVMTATATQARYADLAEMYRADAQYEPGTVLVFGGDLDVTTTGYLADVAVAGVVSTAPAYLMNIDEKHAVPVALRGKVPVKLTGPVRKGDLLVTSSIPGYAESIGKDNTFGAAVFAKSIEEDLSEGQKVITAVIL